MNNLFLLQIFNTKLGAVMMTSVLNGEAILPNILTPVEGHEIRIQTPFSLYEENISKGIEIEEAIENVTSEFCSFGVSNQGNNLVASQIRFELHKYAANKKKTAEKIETAAKDAVALSYPERRPILCVKMIRAVSGCGIREAKEAFEKAFADREANRQERFNQPAALVE